MAFGVGRLKSWRRLDEEGKLLITGWTRKQLKILLVNIPVSISKMYGAYWNTRTDSHDLIPLDFKRGSFLCYVALSKMFKVIDYGYKITLIIGKCEIAIYPDGFKYKVVNDNRTELEGEMSEKFVCIEGNKILEMRMNRFDRMSMENRNIHKVDEFNAFSQKIGYSRDGAPIETEKDDRLFWSIEAKRVLRCIVTVTRDLAPRYGAKSTESSVSISIFSEKGIEILL